MKKKLKFSQMRKIIEIISNKKKLKFHFFVSYRAI